MFYSCHQCQGLLDTLCTEEVNIPSIAPGYSKQRTIRVIIYVSSINFHIFGNYQI